MMTQTTARILDMLKQRLMERNVKGFATYGETLDDVPFENYDWEKMFLEELLDGVQYLMKENERLRQELKEQSGMKLNEYQQMSERTLPKKTSYGYAEKWSEMSKSNYALGLCGESGELGDIVKKNVHHGHLMNKDEFKKEVGDVLHYLAGLCTMFEVSLEECATMNLVKLQKRYPIGFNFEDSIARKDVE